MDIARPEFKERKRRRQIIMVAVIVVAVVAVSAFVYRLKPAAPSVERGTVWTDTVKRGSMLRQVRGIGTLVPSQESVLQIPAETEATVVRIRVLPGARHQIRNPASVPVRFLVISHPRSHGDRHDE